MHETTVLRGLDGQWLEDDNKWTFEVKDTDKDQLEAEFVMGGILLGVRAAFNLAGLKKGVATYKGSGASINSYYPP